MKSTIQDYLSMDFDAAPSRFWQLLFPLPFALRSTILPGSAISIRSWWRD